MRRAVLIIVVLLIGVPVLAGLAETFRGAFGIMPVLGLTEPGLDAWRSLAGQPGFVTALRLTVTTGLAAAALSTAIALLAVAGLHGAGRGRIALRLLAPVLATPHSALAVGLAFLIAPSGWILRLISPWATGSTQPPDLATVGDPAGLALILGLVVKEVPFLVLVMTAALTQIPVRAHLAAGRALGYSAAAVWMRVLLPQLLPLVRLPVLAVVAYSVSVVDMALVLGPGNPPTLSVAVFRWFADPDLGRLPAALAGASLVGLTVAAAIAGWLLVERLIAWAGRVWIRRGARGRAETVLTRTAGALALTLAFVGLAAILALALWSVAFRWPFPSALPESWTLRAWGNTATWGPALANSVLIGAGATGLALCLAIAWLEAEDRAGRRYPLLGAAVIWIPLLVPQIAFLYGTGVLFLRLGVQPGHAAVIAGHLLFVFPYVMLVLADPWRRLDPRLTRTASALGTGPWGRLWRVKLPILLRPVATAAAIGFAVSAAQFLPTLLLGAGRVSTLATEAVSLASGSDRRLAGLVGLVLAGLPLGAYALALGLPPLLHRKRRGLMPEVA
ncbi:MAG: ABC transporter permease [Gemmobacter sp.]